MPQLSSGQTASLVLDPGQSYTISTTGSATVKGIYGAPATTTTLNSNFAVFGPYGVPAKLDIACTSGAASYTLDQYEGDVVRTKTNPFTGGSGNFQVGSRDPLADLGVRQFQLTAIEARGDSLTFGYSFSAGQLDPNLTYAERFADAYAPSSTITNYGYNGSLAVAQVKNILAATATPSQADGLVTLWLAGYNDMAQGDTGVKLECFKNHFSVALALMLSKMSAWRQFYNGGGGGTFYGAPAGTLSQTMSGGIGSLGVNNKWRGLVSTTNGETLTATVNGDVVYVLYEKNTAATGGVFSVSIDGVQVVTGVSCDGTGYTSSGDNPSLLRIPTTPGKHTVVVTVTSPTNASNKVTIDGVAGKSDMLRQTAVIVGLCPRMNAAGYAGTPGAYGSVAIGDAAVAKFQAIQRAVVAQFAADGFNVRAAETSDYLDSTVPANMQTDNIHFTTVGHARIFDAFDGTWKAGFRDIQVGAAGPDMQTLVAPASASAWQNTQRYPVEVVITGGTVSLIEFSRNNVNWVPMASATGNRLTLNPLDYYRVTYTVAPTINLIPR